MPSEAPTVHSLSLVLNNPLILFGVVLLQDQKTELGDGLKTDLQRRNETSCGRAVRQAASK